MDAGSVSHPPYADGAVNPGAQDDRGATDASGTDAREAPQSAGHALADARDLGLARAESVPYAAATRPDSAHRRVSTAGMIASRLDQGRTASGSRSLDGTLADDAAVVVKRQAPPGGCVGKPAGEDCFRRDRGGEALERPSRFHVRFDQADYPSITGAGELGGCRGVVREAITRTARGAGNLPESLVSVMQRMRDEAGSGGGTAENLFSDIQNAQLRRAPFFVGSYSQPGTQRFTEGNYAARTDSFMATLQRRLVPDTIAYVELSHEPRVQPAGASPAQQRIGHVIAVQALRGGHFAVLDPNNGAFEYPDFFAVETALRSYLDITYREAGKRLVPFQASFYSWRGRSAPREVGLLGDPALAAYGASIGSLFDNPTDRPPMAGLSEAMGTYSMQQLANRHSDSLVNEALDLDAGLRSPESRQRLLGEMSRLQERSPIAAIADLDGYVRHAGATALRSAAALQEDLRAHFGERYVGDNGLENYQNDLAVIDLNVREPIAGTSREERTNSWPVIVHRQGPLRDFRNDRYEVYDPNFGVFRYDNFEQMSRAVRNLFQSGYREYGGIDHATTTWFADKRTAKATRAAASVQSVSLRPSPGRNVTLGDLERELGLVVNPMLVPPLDNQEPAPATERPDFCGVLPRIDQKRSPDSQPSAAPLALYTPSTATPLALKANGGFDTGQSQLENINLSMHNFDIASHGAITTSAGFIATFREAGTAFERLMQRSPDGYVYVIARSPNMVNVNASLKAHTLSPENHEFAAMGHVDFTQVVGYWPVKDGKAGRFIANHLFRWDVYNRLRPPGAQPQLGRFSMNSAAWREPAYSPFVSPFVHKGRAIGLLPKEDPNLTQAEFYGKAMSLIHHVADRQSQGVDFQGRLTLGMYGRGGVHPILYADSNDTLYFGVLSDTDRTKYRTQFAMGADGRFHYADNYGKVLRVDRAGKLYVGARPTDPSDLNGVFEYHDHHLVHRADHQFLIAGSGRGAPYLAADTYRTWSTWHFEDAQGKTVTPPYVNAHSYAGSTAGDAARLYEFSRNPDSALPAGTTGFITKVPGVSYQGMFRDYRGMSYDEVQNAAAWLDGHRVAWLFRDGFYAEAKSPTRIDIRKLDGTTVRRFEIDRATHKRFRYELAPLGRRYEIDPDAWQLVVNGQQAAERIEQRFFLSM